MAGGVVLAGEEDRAVLVAVAAGEQVGVQALVVLRGDAQLAQCAASHACACSAEPSAVSSLGFHAVWRRETWLAASPRHATSWRPAIMPARRACAGEEEGVDRGVGVVVGIRNHSVPVRGVQRSGSATSVIATITPAGSVDLHALWERGVQLGHGTRDLGGHRRGVHETSCARDRREALSC